MLNAHGFICHKYVRVFNIFQNNLIKNLRFKFDNLLCSTRVSGRELTAIQTYLEWAPARQLESAHDAEGPLYYAVMALLLQPPQKLVLINSWTVISSLK